MNQKTTLEKSIKEFAEQNGYVLKKKYLKSTIAGLLKNKELYGEFYCPCRRIIEDNEKYLKSIICPCDFVHQEVKKKGHCHCMLYWKS